MLRSDDNDILEVLGRSADQGDTAYVDLLNDVLLVRTRGYSLLEGIEVHDNEVYLRDFILGDLGSVALIITTSQDAPEYLRMECLHTATEDGGIARQVFYLITGDTERLYKRLCTTRRYE